MSGQPSEGLTFLHLEVLQHERGSRLVMGLATTSFSLAHVSLSMPAQKLWPWRAKTRIQTFPAELQ